MFPIVAASLSQVYSCSRGVLRRCLLTVSCKYTGMLTIKPFRELHSHSSYFTSCNTSIIYKTGENRCYRLVGNIYWQLLNTLCMIFSNNTNPVPWKFAYSFRVSQYRHALTYKKENFTGPAATSNELTIYDRQTDRQYRLCAATIIFVLTFYRKYESGHNRRGRKLTVRWSIIYTLHRTLFVR
jgi:hypothetical protein